MPHTHTDVPVPPSQAHTKGSSQMAQGVGTELSVLISSSAKIPGPWTVQMSLGCPFLEVLALWGVVCLYGPHHCRMVQVAAWNKPQSWERCFSSRLTPSV